MELQNGRPQNTDNRLDKEIRVYDFLDKLGIKYQRIDHEAAMTMEACEEIDQALGDNTTICKNLFLCNRQETDFYLLLMPDERFRKKSHRLGEWLQSVAFNNSRQGVQPRLVSYKPALHSFA